MYPAKVKSPMSSDCDQHTTELGNTKFSGLGQLLLKMFLSLFSNCAHLTIGFSLKGILSQLNQSLAQTDLYFSAYSPSARSYPPVLIQSDLSGFTLSAVLILLSFPFQPLLLI